jgi:hypothetical protein
MTAPAMLMLLACGDVPEHASGPASLACFTCHGDRYLAASDPNHVVAGYPQSCEGCHTTSAWRPAVFGDHAGWPLTGAHLGASCESCHIGGVYSGTPRACAGCHQPDYDRTSDPPHAASGFPTSCESCHDTAAWVPASFSHDLVWPLVGEHADTACESCHAGGVYGGTPRDCVGCHRPEYDATTDPAHAASGFPTACEACHSPSGWVPAAYDHGQYWPLEGRHASLGCEACHADGVYAGTPRACLGCHEPDYAGTSNPSHGALGLPTACETCHGAASWETRTFPGHDALFRISSGHHRYDCASCHLTEAWATFTCTGCHEGEHTLARMNAKHDEEPGYQQTLTAYGVEAGCLHCHPRGDD